MTLRTYIIFAVVAFAIAASWLWAYPVTVIAWFYVSAVLYITAGLFSIYGIVRLFWAIIHRLER